MLTTSCPTRTLSPIPASLGSWSCQVAGSSQLLPPEKRLFWRGDSAAPVPATGASRPLAEASSGPMAPKAVPIPRGRLPTHPSRSRPVKDSFRSHSSEADDERSSTASDRMSPPRRNSTSSDRARARSPNSHQLRVDTGNGSPPPGRYPGEDTRSTSPKELAGWYAYAFAAEVYVVCAIGTIALCTLD